MSRILVDIRNPWDRSVIALSQKFFTIKTIAKETGLTISQVNYRRRLANLRIQDRRNGLTPETALILENIRRQLKSIEKLKEAGYIGRANGHRVTLQPPKIR